MISKNNKIIQIKVSKNAYEFLRNLSKLFNISISKFCEDAVVSKIINTNKLTDSELIQHMNYLKETYKDDRYGKQ